ncbi:MAG: hypothetical protein OHK0046_48320 [Anaerolineae bacterium]
MFPLTVSPPPSIDFGFTGEQRDDNGLVYLRARYYHPTLGVFPSRDPFAGTRICWFIRTHGVSGRASLQRMYDAPSHGLDVLRMTEPLSAVNPCLSDTFAALPRHTSTYLCMTG